MYRKAPARPPPVLFALAAMAALLAAMASAKEDRDGLAYDWRMVSVPVPEPRVDFTRGTTYSPGAEFDHNPHAADAKELGTNAAPRTEFDHQVVDKQRQASKLRMFDSNGFKRRTFVAPSDEQVHHIHKWNNPEIGEPPQDHGPPMSLSVASPPSRRAEMHVVPTSESSSLVQGHFLPDVTPDPVRLSNCAWWCCRLDIYHDGQWGTICDNGFSHQAAQVACRQIGCTGGWAHGWYGSAFRCMLCLLKSMCRISS